MQLFFNAQKVYRGTKVNQYFLSYCICYNLDEKTGRLTVTHN